MGADEGRGTVREDAQRLIHFIALVSVPVPCRLRHLLSMISWRLGGCGWTPVRSCGRRCYTSSMMRSNSVGWIGEPRA
jgi:hypothetical protein